MQVYSIDKINIFHIAFNLLQLYEYVKKLCCKVVFVNVLHFHMFKLA